MTERANLKYRAFLSYSHRDEQSAKWLHSALEDYRVDKNLVGRVTPFGPIPTKLRPIFRDREDFSAGHSLNAQTLAALERSDFLIVLCSPNAVASKYVNEEIRRFKAMGRADRVIPVIIAGEPGDPDAECFPESLRFKLASDGTLSAEREEPIAADARPGRDGKIIAKQKVVAGLLGVGLDEIMRRDEQARRRHVLIRNVIVAVLIGLTTVSGTGFAWARYELARNEELLDRTLQRATGLVNEAVRVSQQFGVPHTVSLTMLEQAEGVFRDMSELGRETTQLRYRKAVMLIEFARNYAILGNTQGRHSRAFEADQLLSQLVAAAPENQTWQSALAIAETELANALVAEGKLPEALQEFRAALAIRKNFAATTAQQLDWQIQLAGLYRMIGVILTSQGQSAKALASYQAAIAIDQRLARQDARNIALQRDLALDHFQIGDLYRQESNLGESLREFRTSLDLRQRIVDAAPDDPNAQIDLSWSYSRVADVLGAQLNLTDALENQQKALTIRERIAALDRTNAVWQHDLMWAYSRVGDVLRLQGNLDKALDNDQDALAIATRLATADPSNNAAQRELSAQYMKIGDVQRLRSAFDAALVNYQASLALSQRVSAGDPSNSIWRCEITMRQARVGITLLRQKKTTEALRSFQDALAIMRKLSAADSANASWQEQLAWIEEWIGYAQHLQGENTEALASYRESREIFERLAQSDPANAFVQHQAAATNRVLKQVLDAPQPEAGLRPNTCGAPPPAFGEF